MGPLNAWCTGRKAAALAISALLLIFVFYGGRFFASPLLRPGHFIATGSSFSAVHEVTCQPCPDCNSAKVAKIEQNSEDCGCGTGFKKRFPQAVIIGAKKAGTRALIDMLKSHPKIVAARGELHYFDKDENFDHGVQWYIDRMPCTTEDQITIEKSPGYFVSKVTPLRMQMVSANVKLILIVRNPIDRLLSDFAQLNDRKEKKDKSTRNSFEELVFLKNGEVNTEYTPVSVSTYAGFFAKWLEHFKPAQIHVVNGDELIKSPVTALQKVEQYLQVPSYFNSERFYFNESKGFYCWKKDGRRGGEVSYCLGEGKGRKHETLSPSAIAKLKEFYEPHNQKFYKLVGQDFGW